MSSTTHAVKNAAATLKKAADPWNKEGRETADRIVSAAISVTDTQTLDQAILDTLLGLLRRPFAELYITHPGPALRLSAAIFTAMIHDKIAQSWKTRDTQNRSNWEQVAAILLAGVQDHVEVQNNERVKLVVAQAFYAIICNAFFSASSIIPLPTYSVSLRISAYSLLSMTADGCVENKNKLRDNKILGGVKLGRVITLTKDYLVLEQLLILLAYLLPPTEGTVAGRAERLGFLRDCFVDSAQCGKDLIELLKFVASPDWEITSDKIVDILARDISVAQPFIMKSFVLNGLSNPRLNPANRFYLDRNSILFNCEDEDGKIEGVHVPYDSIRHVDLSSSGTIVFELSSPPQCHETLQAVTHSFSITMTILISPKDVEHFARTLRTRGMTNQIKLNGIPIRRATVRSSVNISPARLEFEQNDQSVTSYQRKVKVIEEGVLQASDPGDDIIHNLEVCVNELQDRPPLLVKEYPSTRDLQSIPVSVTTRGTKVKRDGGCDHVSSPSRHQLSSIHEDPQKCQTTTSLDPGPPSPPRGSEPPPLRAPRAPLTPDGHHDRDHIYSTYSSPSEHSHHSRPTDKSLGDAIFGASDEVLSPLSDTDSILCTIWPSKDNVRPRRIIRGANGSERGTRSQRHRHPHLSAKPTSPISNLEPAQDPPPEQKLVAMVKGLKVMDSQDIVRVKSDLGAVAATKRKKIVLESEEETEDENRVPSVVENYPPMSTSNLCPGKKVSRRKNQRVVTTAQNRTATLERPKRACVSTKLRTNPRSSLVVDQGLDKVKTEELTGGSDGRNNPNDRRTPGEGVSEELAPVPTVELKCKRPVAEGDAPGTSSKQGQPRKRVRLETEGISSLRNKACRSKKPIPVGKPRKAAPSRVRKTYRNRQKIERFSPGHCVVGDVDYDEIPLPTAAVNLSTAKERIPSPTKTRNTISTSELLVKDTNGWSNPPGSAPFTAGPAPAVEIPDNETQEKKETPRHADACHIRGSPTGVTADDDDPIRSFSSSPSEPMPLAIDLPEPQVAVAHEGVCSDYPPIANSLVNSLDITPVVSMHTQNTKEVTANPESETVSRPVAACDAISQDIKIGSENQSTIPAVTKHKGSPKATMDLDYFDGPTVIVAESSESHKEEISSTNPSPRPVLDVIDLTGDTTPPMCLPSGCVGDRTASLHDVPTGSPILVGEEISSHVVPTDSPGLSKGGTSEDISHSSLLDLAEMKYRDFDVSLNSSLCLPSSKTWEPRRPPTPPPPRTKRKGVTFAALPEEAIDENPETRQIPVEALAPPIMENSDELEYLELAPELVQGSGSSPRVDSFHCLGRHLPFEPRPSPPSPHPASWPGKTTQPPPLLSSPLTLSHSYSHRPETSPYTTRNGKQRHRARATSSSPSNKAETIARGNYVAPIMAVLDEIHAIIKNNVQTRFERLDRHAVELRRLVLAQTKVDMTALLDEYIAAFNSLVRLEAKYGAFSKQRIAAFAQARDADAQSLSTMRTQIQTHDRAMQVHARQTFTVGPLPVAVQRWL